MRQAISYEMLMMLAGPTGATETFNASGAAKLDFVQSYDFSFNVERAALKQLGTGIVATRQTQFAPDVDLNIQHYLNDGWNENFIGLNINSGSYVNPFSNILTQTTDKNFYVLISPDNYVDVNSKGSTSSASSPEFNDFNVLGIGNSYISNFELSVAVNELAKVNASFVAANARVQRMNQTEFAGNFLYSPAVFTTGTGFIAANDTKFSFTKLISKFGSLEYRELSYSEDLYLSVFGGGCPYGGCIVTGYPTLSNGIRFGFDFDNFQSMAISVPFERKSLYGFGSNHPQYRKIQKPIIATLSLDSLVDTFHTENLVSTFSAEDKTISGYNFDIMFSNYTGKNKFGVKIQNARLDSYSIGNSIGDRSVISTSWSFEITESTGILFSGSYVTPAYYSNRVTDTFNNYPQ